MTLKLTLRNKEYETIYDYPEDVKIILSPVDGHSFIIMRVEDEFYCSASSHKSFEESEKSCYKKYIKSLTCDHVWKRWMPHARYGICEKCSLTHRSMFEIPFNCDHDNCDLLGDHSIYDCDETNPLYEGKFDDKRQKNLCFNHYYAALENLYKNYIDLKENKNRSSHNDNLSDHHNSILFCTLKKIKADYPEFLEKNNKDLYYLVDSKVSDACHLAIRNIFINLKEDRKTTLLMALKFRTIFLKEDFDYIADKALMILNFKEENYKTEKDFIIQKKLFNLIEIANKTII